MASLDKACGKFINNNSVTKKANASSKSPELLAKYCDLLLKKSSRNPEEAELEDTLNQVVSAHICQKTEFRVRLFLTHHSGLEKVETSLGPEITREFFFKYFTFSDGGKILIFMEKTFFFLDFTACCVDDDLLLDRYIVQHTVQFLI